MHSGSAVISKAGSDKGKTYVVVGFDDKGYALVSDEKRHGLSAPKKKNVRHLSDTGISVEIPKTDALLVTTIRRLPPSQK